MTKSAAATMTPTAVFPVDICSIVLSGFGCVQQRGVPWINLSVPLITAHI